MVMVLSPAKENMPLSLSPETVRLAASQDVAMVVEPFVSPSTAALHDASAVAFVPPLVSGAGTGGVPLRDRHDAAARRSAGPSQRLSNDAGFTLRQEGANMARPLASEARMIQRTGLRSGSRVPPVIGALRGPAAPGGSDEVSLPQVGPAAATPTAGTPSVRL